jgi:hypothetical protein
MPLSPDERYYLSKAMARYGGRFVSSLAAAFCVADGHNQDRILVAFPDYVRDYGPGSKFYDLVCPAKQAA